MLQDPKSRDVNGRRKHLGIADGATTRVMFLDRVLLGMASHTE